MIRYSNVAEQTMMHEPSLKTEICFDVSRLADAIAEPWLANYGITQYVRRMCEELPKIDNAVLLPVAVPCGSRQKDKDQFARSVDSLCREAQLAVSRAWENASLWKALGRCVRRMAKSSFISPYFRKKAATRAALYEKRSIRYVWSDFSGIKQRVYHSPVGPLPPACSMKGVVRFLTVHDCIPAMPTDRMADKTISVTDALKSIDVSRDYVICDSPCTRDDVLSITHIDPQRTKVVPLAHAPLYEKPAIREAKAELAKLNVEPMSYMLALGQNHPRKNLRRLVSAYDLLRSNPNCANFPLVIVTEPAAMQATRQIVKTNSHANNIHILSAPNDLLSGLYACAAVFAYVSLKEGFGLPVLEAMASGCPVVTSSDSAMSEICEDAAVYVDPTCPAHIADGLAKVLSSDTLRAALIDKGRQRAALYSWQRTAKESFDFYLYGLAREAR